MSAFEKGDGGTYWYRETDGTYTQYLLCMNFECGWELPECAQYVKVSDDPNIRARWKAYCKPCAIRDLLETHAEQRNDMIKHFMLDREYRNTYEEANKLVRSYLCDCTGTTIGELCKAEVP